MELIEQRDKLVTALESMVLLSKHSKSNAVPLNYALNLLKEIGEISTLDVPDQLKRKLKQYDDELAANEAKRIRLEESRREFINRHELNKRVEFKELLK